MGTPDFAVASLNKLIAAGHEVAAVVTVPDKPKGRGQVLQPSAVKKAALTHGIPVLQPGKLKDDAFINDLRILDAELFVVVAFRILPREVFTIPLRGTLNVHASLLPKYRGAAPINWAIINGEKETGVTTMIIDEKVDTGGTLLQRSVPIFTETTAGELHDVLAKTGAELLIETVSKLQKNEITPLEQHHQLATRAPKITKEICRLNFNQSAEKVHNNIRGLSPYPASLCLLDDNVLKIYKASVTENRDNHDSPGKILNVKKHSFFVACNPGILEITEIQLQGKRRMSVADFLNGFSLLPGAILK